MCRCGVKADALDDLLGVKALHLGIGVQLVEEGDAERQICVCKQFDGLCLCEAHEEGLDIFLDGPLLQQRRERARGLRQTRVVRVGAHDDAHRLLRNGRGLGPASAAGRLAIICHGLHLLI